MVVLMLVFLMTLFGLFFCWHTYWIKLLKNKIAVNKAALKKQHDANQHLHHLVLDLQNKLQRAIQDPVTHLPGWPLFEDRVEQGIKESERYQFTMGLLLVDINDFKLIDAALDQENSNQLLRQITERIQKGIRQVDSLTRFSKNTFAILLTQLAKPEMGALVAQRLLQFLKEPFLIQNQAFYVTVCIGIAIYPVDGNEISILLRHAEQALNKAKAHGYPIYQFYQEKLHSNSQRELILHNSLRRDSLFNELIVYYQAIMDTQHKNVFCMDTLLYWQHPELGLIGPQELYRYAETQQKINDILTWLLQQACKQFTQWQASGFTPQLLGITLSMKQLANSSFICRLSQILQETQFNPKCLLLEIKGAVTPLLWNELEKTLNMLKYLGVRLAINDFGTEAFSLSQLNNIAVNYLKLDTSFIQNMDQQGKTSMIVKAILFLAQNLSLSVIAPGVESAQQATLLRSLGCSLMQGQFLSPPLLQEEVISKMLVT